MDIQEVINQIAAGDSAAAKEGIENVLSAKAFDALQSRKQEMAATIFGGQEQEHEEVADDEEAAVGFHGDVVARIAATGPVQSPRLLVLEGILLRRGRRRRKHQQGNGPGRGPLNGHDILHGSSPQSRHGPMVIPSAGRR